LTGGYISSNFLRLPGCARSAEYNSTRAHTYGFVLFVLGGVGLVVRRPPSDAHDATPPDGRVLESKKKERKSRRSARR
jgi:hypothetical protein